MGLEQRKGSTYYYRKERRNGKVVSVYCGGGRLAVLSAELDALEREGKLLERLERKEETDTVRSVLSDERLAWAKINAELGAFMSAAGYHKHKGQWRKRREERTS